MFPSRALFAAAASGDADVLSQATELDLRIFDPVTGDTLAHLATQKNFIDVVRVLAERVPDIFATRNVIGRSVLLEAVLYDHLDIARLVAKVEPRTIFLKDYFGHSPLASPKFVDVIDDDTWTYSTPMLGYTIMHEAVLHDLKHVVHAAIRKIPQSIRSATIDGMTPIHFAAFLGRVEIVEILLRAFPECIGFVTDKGKTPLFCASEYSPWKNSKVIRTLFAERPELAKVQDSRGRTPVFEISKIGVAEDVKFMLDAYPELALVRENEFGLTPLHVSLYGRYNAWANMAKTIVSACPESLRVKDDTGLTPIDHVPQVLDPREEECGDFLSHILRYSELPDELWDYIPRGCKHASGALGAALERSFEEAKRVVGKMSDDDRERLRMALLVLTREQAKRHTYSEDVTRRILANIF